MISGVLVGGIVAVRHALRQRHSALRHQQGGVQRSPKVFKGAYLPRCCLWIPERAEVQQPIQLLGYAGRVADLNEMTVQVFVDQRTDWWASEQQIPHVHDAQWPVLLNHKLLGGTVTSATNAEPREGRGFY